MFREGIVELVGEAGAQGEALVAAASRGSKRAYVNSVEQDEKARLTRQQRTMVYDVRCILSAAR